MNRAEALTSIQQTLSAVNPRDLVDYQFRKQLLSVYESACDDVRDEVQSQRAKKRLLDKQRREEQSEQAVKWAVDNLEPGMNIKVVGTRDGVGARQVLEVNYKRKEVVCRKLYLDTKTGEIKVEPYITTHMFKKVRGTIAPIERFGGRFVQYGWKWEVENSALQEE